MIEFKQREKRFIIVCVVVVLAAFVHAVIVSPALKKRAALDTEIRQTRNQLGELRLLEREYDQILKETKKIKEHMSERPRDFALFSFLDRTANKLDLKNNLTSMKPSQRTLDSDLAEEMVEIRLEGISLANLVAYMHEIEKTGAAIAIATIRIQPEARLGGGLNVSMLVTSLGPP
jgi:type II secretory pathway component PulM